MRDTPEGRGAEAPVIGDIVAPDDLPIGEHFVELTEVGHGQRTRGQGFDGVARHDMSGDGAELACLPVEEVGRDGLGSRQSPKLVANQAETLGQVRDGSDDTRHGEESGGLS